MNAKLTPNSVYFVKNINPAIIPTIYIFLLFILFVLAYFISSYKLYIIIGKQNSSQLDPCLNATDVYSIRANNGNII